MMMIALDLFCMSLKQFTIKHSQFPSLSFIIGHQKHQYDCNLLLGKNSVFGDTDKQFKWSSNHLTSLTNPLVIRLAQSASQHASLKHSARLLSALDCQLSSDPAQIAAFCSGKSLTDRHLFTATFWDNWARLPCFVWTAHSANGYSTDSAELSASPLESTVVWQYNKQAWTEPSCHFVKDKKHVKDLNVSVP